MTVPGNQNESVLLYGSFVIRVGKVAGNVRQNNVRSDAGRFQLFPKESTAVPKMAGNQYVSPANPDMSFVKGKGLENIWLLIRIKYDKSIWWMPWH